MNFYFTKYQNINPFLELFFENTSHRRSSCTPYIYTHCHPAYFQIEQLVKSNQYTMSIHSTISTVFFLLPALVLSGSAAITGPEFSIKEATVHDFRMAFKQNKLTSR